MMYHIFLDPPKSPLKRGTLKNLAPLKLMMYHISLDPSKSTLKSKTLKNLDPPKSTLKSKTLKNLAPLFKGVGGNGYATLRYQ
jgi:aspartyl/asparaginyl beta-hydroxylase (cupin superfamily)